MYTPIFHGTLSVTIHEARNIANTDGKFGIPGFRKKDLTDPYVRIAVDGLKGPRTTTILNSLNPSWNEVLTVHLNGPVNIVTFEIKDEDTLNSAKVGKVDVPISQLTAGLRDGIFNISTGGSLRITSIYIDAEASKSSPVVPGTTFPIWDNCRVTMYQDAHISDETRRRLPQITYSGGIWNRSSCWEEMHAAIRDAQNFIYITGWSVKHDVTLLRERAVDAWGITTLGAMLKVKADQGVRVCVLVWDEMLSMESELMNRWFATTKTGLMSTYDEETKTFFKDTSVVCESAKRSGSGVSSDGTLNLLTSALGKFGKGMVFTHHQKTVVCDCPSADPSGRRGLVAFVGGLDLTSGRFDTPEHHIFDTLQTWHANDFHNPCIPGVEQVYGPREPWHDIHCKVEGRIAYDVLKNFEQRWRTQTKAGEALLQLHRYPILTLNECILHIEHPWSCQLFRSIDNNSAEIEGVERGIQDAYIHQIRRAEHFIYIENQYFLGSSKHWTDFDDKSWNVECKHQVPVEIVSTIVSKIMNRRTFCVYVVLPLFPEGVPESGAVQAILFWQFKTIEMMYLRINEALLAYGPPHDNPDATAIDYLQFYFLGNRQAYSPQGAPGPRQAMVLQSKRNMIYVHSKMMIVDDEYILIGSANINERSMAGDRDTEIAVGCFQPTFSKNESSTPTGDVSAFRKALWSEHTGIYEECFDHPQSRACTRKMREIGQWNSMYYMQAEPCSMPGHLCNYPYTIDNQGRLTETFCEIPDHPGAKVRGAPQRQIPNILTT